MLNPCKNYFCYVTLIPIQMKEVKNVHEAPNPTILGHKCEIMATRQHRCFEHLKSVTKVSIIFHSTNIILNF